MDMQNTVKQAVSITGIALHTGARANLKICPAPVNTGIVFRRVDMPGAPSVKAEAGNVIDVRRATTIASRTTGAFVVTVEHVMAALHASCVDNAIVEMDGAEPPIADGSAGPYFDMIQSVDRWELVQCLQKAAEKKNIIQNILLEVNVGAEESKSGFSPAETMEVAAKIGEFPNLRLCGLMAIPPISRYPGQNRTFFAEIRQLAVDIGSKKYDNVTMECLSMGMSDDYADAIAEGSTMIRVGTAIFGARNYAK